MPAEIVLEILVIWLFQDKLSSIIKPNGLVLLTFIIWFPSTETLISDISCVWSLWREPIIMNSVLAMLRLHLFAFSHMFKLFSSIFMFCSKSLRFELKPDKLQNGYQSNYDDGDYTMMVTIPDKTYWRQKEY